MNIPELQEKIKDTLDRVNTREIYTVLLILVVGFGSFGLGRLSKLEEGKSPIRIEQASAAILSSPSLEEGDKIGSSNLPLSSPSLKEGEAPLAPGGQLVASKGGTKYHFPWCSGAQRISEANKIWFNSAEEARKAGYTPASNCKGLR